MAISKDFQLNPPKAIGSAFCCKGESEVVQDKMRCLTLLFARQILIIIT